MQIEELLLEYSPTLLFVEHDSEFYKNIATDIFEILSGDRDVFSEKKVVTSKSRGKLYCKMLIFSN